MKALIFWPIKSVWKKAESHHENWARISINLLDGITAQLNTHNGLCICRISANTWSDQIYCWQFEAYVNIYIYTDTKDAQSHSNLSLWWLLLMASIFSCFMGIGWRMTRDNRLPICLISIFPCQTEKSPQEWPKYCSRYKQNHWTI